MNDTTPVEIAEMALKGLGCRVEREEYLRGCKTVLTVTNRRQRAFLVYNPLGLEEARVLDGDVIGSALDDFVAVREHLRVGDDYLRLLHPSTLVARILRELGLFQRNTSKHRRNFKATRVLRNKQRVGTQAILYSREAEQVVAANAALIEGATELTGYPFHVHLMPVDGCPEPIVFLDNMAR